MLRQESQRGLARFQAALAHNGFEAVHGFLVLALEIIVDAPEFGRDGHDVFIAQGLGLPQAGLDKGEPFVCPADDILVQAHDQIAACKRPQIAQTFGHRIGLLQQHGYAGDVLDQVDPEPAELVDYFEEERIPFRNSRVGTAQCQCLLQEFNGPGFVVRADGHMGNLPGEQRGIMFPARLDQERHPCVLAKGVLQREPAHCIDQFTKSLFGIDAGKPS